MQSLPEIVWVPLPTRVLSLPPPASCSVLSPQAKLRVEEMCTALTSNEGDSRDLLMERYGDALIDWCSDDHLGKFGNLVEAAVDPEAMKKGEYLISPAYNEELQEIKEERDGVERQADKELSAAAADLGLVAGKTIKLDETSKAGYCFRITKSEEKGVRKQLNAGYVTLETRKDGVKFTSSRLRRLSERHLALTEDYVAKQRALVHKVVAVAQTFVEVRGWLPVAVTARAFTSERD